MKSSDVCTCGHERQHHGPRCRQMRQRLTTDEDSIGYDDDLCECDAFVACVPKAKG